ncbi:hypothetical protein GCM10027610_126300 [Dactylosporangium cerinum]
MAAPGRVRGVAGAAGLAVLLPTGTAGAGWFLAGQVLNANAMRAYPVRVRAHAGNRVTLTRTPDTARSMPLAFVWPSGHAVLGPVIATDRTSVTREIASLTRGTLTSGLKGYTTGYVFEGDPLSARGLPFEEVLVPAELGDCPAWLVPPTSGPADDTWIIAVHGRGRPAARPCASCPPSPRPVTTPSSSPTATTPRRSPAPTPASTSATPNGATSCPPSTTPGPPAPARSSWSAGPWAAPRSSTSCALGTTAASSAASSWTAPSSTGPRPCG